MSNRFAMVFPGQGSQSVGMLADLAERFPCVEETFKEASDALGYDMWALVQNGPAEEIKKTEVTQPVMLVGGVAVWRAWQAEGGPKPSVLGGHSLGEYTALVCANSMDFTDAVKTVRLRGRYMQESVPLGTGAMAALLGLDDEAVVKICEEASAGEVVAAANFNSPGQVVIGGHQAAVDRAIALAKEAGAKKAMPVAMSAPSHCALMLPAAERLAADLETITIREPEIDIVNNVAAAIEKDPAKIKQALIDQVSNPVLWVSVVRNIIAQDINKIIECGPGKVLTGLNKRIDKSVPTLPAFDCSTFDAALAALSE